jgi:hypothetical protein
MKGRSLLGKTAKKQRYAFAMRNRMDERIDFQRTVTDGRWRYIRNYMPHRPWGQHQAFAWLTKGYQDWEAAHLAGTLNPVQDRFFQPKPYEELYDLTADPHEINNLADAPDNRRVLATLSKALDAHMLAIHDNGFLPESMEGEGYVPSRNPKLYPLAQVMDLAAIAAGGEAEAVPRLAAALASDTPVLRYWAATGLLICGSKAGVALPQLKAAMRNDACAFVKIVCAEAVAKLMTGDQEPIKILADLVDSSSVWQVQLHALNALTFLGPAARQVQQTIAKAALSEQEYIRSAGRYAAAVLEGSYTPATPIFDFEWLMSQMKTGT